jgi:hypothetical protein
MQTNNSIIDIAKSIALDIGGNTAYRRFQNLYIDDRIAFVYDCFPKYAATLTEYQEEIFGYFDEGKNRVAVKGPHGLGKTFLASILVHHTVLTSPTDCKVPTTASALRQLERYLWPEIKKSSSNLAWPVIGREAYDPRTELLTYSIRLNRGLVEAFAVASDNYTLIEGAHATIMFYVFDEAKAIPPGMWDAAEGAFSTEGLGAPDSTAVTTLMTNQERFYKDVLVRNSSGERYKVNVLAISTPGPPVGRFFDIHSHKPGYEDWTTRSVTLDEAIRAGRISAQWAEQRKLQWGETSPTYQNRVLGEFADRSEDGLIPASWVRTANDRWADWDKRGRPDLGSPQTIGVDTARMGDDSTVLALRGGSAISNIYNFSKVPTTETTANVERYCKGRTVVIETDGGLGAAVYDMLRQDNIPDLKPVTVGGKSFFRDRSGELSFADVRAAMWWNMRELLDPINGDGIMLPPDDRLTLDLTAPDYQVLRNGVIRVESKDSIRKKIGRSTDFGDAVCLAFWKTSSGGGVVV